MFLRKNKVDTRFIFAISFKSKAVSEDWALAQRLLDQTIHSICNSTSKDFLIVVACHELPYFANSTDARVVFLRAPFRPAGKLINGASDKLRKRRLIGAWIRRHVCADGVYVMWCDADDLVHKGVVEYVLRNDNRRSYLVEQGYLYDCTTHQLVPNDQHHALCGTCFACYYRRRDLPWAWFDRWSNYSKFERHNQFTARAADIGRSPDVFPFRAVTYLANHRESLKLHRMRQLYHHETPALDVKEASAVLANDFSISEVETGQGPASL